MTPPQFLHVDYFKRIRERTPSARRSVSAKHGTFRSSGWSAADILAEQARLEGHCEHVTAPQAPTLLHGVPPMKVLEIIEDWVRAQEEATKTSATPHGKRYPKNRPVMAAGVISYPREDIGGWPAYRDASVQWLKQRYGARLRCVVEHAEDEAHPHLHYILVPLPGEGVEAVHEGYAAQLQRRRDFYKETGMRGRGERLGTYRLMAMRELQDTFHREVSSRFGMVRMGPQRARTSYQDAKRRQRQEQRDTESLELARWHQERQAREDAERADLLAFQYAHLNKEEIVENYGRIDPTADLWELAQDAVNVVWKLSAEFPSPLMADTAQKLVKRYNTLVKSGRWTRDPQVG